MGPTIKETKFMFKRIKKSPLSIVGIAIVLFFALIGVLAPVLAPPQGKDPFRIPRYAFGVEPVPPSYQYPFGVTGEEQYDIYYGVVWGTISAFRVGLYVTFATLAIGLVIGVLAGYYGGIVDEIMMRFTDIILAFPGLILAMAIVTVFGQGLDNVMLALILVGWPSYTRVIRGEVLRTKQEDYVEAAKAVGCSDFRITLRHILPNSIYSTMIMATMDIGSIVLAAAALSFLGLGAPTGYADWGQMVSYSRSYIQPYYWYVFLIPGAFMFTFCLGWNLLGDALRDVFDPTLRRR